MSQPGEHDDRVPNRLAVEDCRGRGDGDADERIKRHGSGEAQRLTQHLLPLALGVAGEVRNVERHRGPESDYTGERWNEEGKELFEGFELRRHGEYGAEAASLGIGPAEQAQT